MPVTSAARPPARFRQLTPVLYVAAVVTLLWPLLLSGGPFVFDDSVPYVRGGATGMQMLFGWDSVLADAWRQPADAGGGAAPAAAPSAPTGPADGPSPDAYRVSGARSTYYAVYAFLGADVIGPWGVPVLNALLICATAALISCILTGAAAPGALALIGAGMVTTLPFFVCFIMPDIFAGVAVLGTAVMMSHGRRLAMWQLMALTALVLMASLVHKSHLLIVVGLIACGGLICVLLPRLTLARRSLMAALVVVVGTLGGYSLSNHVVERSYGYAPVSPPFLTARLIADGPGLYRLRSLCPTPGTVYCPYLDNIPQDPIMAGTGVWYSDGFLWSTDPKGGVYGIASPEERQQMSAQDKGFALDTARAYPADVAGNLLRHMLRQLTLFGLDEFSAPFAPAPTEQLFGQITPWIALSQSTYNGFLTRFERVTQISFVVALVALVAMISRRGSLDPRDHQALVSLVALLGLGLLGNALILGGLSGPHERYQARVAWIPVFAALLIWQSRRSQTAPPGATRRRPRASRIQGSK